ncbi:dipeptidase [Sphingorhabdus arenilitoris]|uniref:Dipeptidase n=1 Tax=Sphingorhabdus arenilitoris TaxID=1490041 RepID=A0ABV8RDX4_9SPHN
MIRKLVFALLILIIAAACGLLLFGPGYTERSMNIVDGKPLLKVSDEAAALHKTLTIVDLHSDSLMWDRDITKQAARGQMDVPRMKTGNVALQIFSSVTKTPRGQNYDSNSDKTDNITPLVMAQLQPLRTWSSLLERSLYHAQKLTQASAASKGELTVITAAPQIAKLISERGTRNWPMGAMMSVEGLHNLEGKRTNLQRLYDGGVRMAGLTHFFDNELAGSMHGFKKGGLTPFGKQIIADMEAKGIIVDIAHCSHQCVAEVIAIAKRPIVSSHGGVQATCSENRNLTDAEIKGVAATGGVIGVGYWEGAVCNTSPAAIAKAIKHVRDLVGIEYAALGSDYDGAVTVRFDTSKLVQVTQALMDAGFSEQDIRAVMGLNALRVLSAGIIPQSGRAS